MLTIPEIYSLLDLLPTQVVGEDASRVLVTYPRSCGRTIQMLVLAVEKAQSKKVAFVGYNRDLTHEYVRRARLMCNKLGIDPNNIVELDQSIWKEEQNKRQTENLEALYDYYNIFI